MRVAIIGSPGLEISHLEHYLPEETSELLAGGAASMDRCVCFYAAANHIPCRSCPPKKQPDGGAAVPAGAALVDQADMLLAFWDRKGGGIRRAIEYAMETGKALRVVL